MGGFPRINWPKVNIPSPKPIHLPPPLPPPKPIRLPPPPPPIRLPPPPPPVRIAPPPKPKVDMEGLQKFTGALAGAVSVTPMGKIMMMGITGVADLSTGGKASNYLNSGMQVNSTVSMLPGGVLAQRLANDATGGKSGAVIGKFVPDPMHMAVHDAKTIGATLFTDPKNTLNATNKALADNRASLVTVGTNYSYSPVSTIAAKSVSVAPKASLLAVTAARSTIAAVVPVSTIKPSLLPAAVKVFEAPSTISALVPVPAPPAQTETIAPRPPSSAPAPIIAPIVEMGERTTLSGKPVAVEPASLGGTTLSNPAAVPPSIETGYLLPLAALAGLAYLLL